MKEQGNTPLQTAVTSNQRETSVIPTGQFNFIPVEDMFEGPETQLAEVLATDPGAIANVGAYKADIDKYGIPAMASLGVARPSLATGLFDPVKQQNPPQDTYNTVKSILKAESAGPAADIVDPRFANIRQSNFLRYYEHPDFAQLGFTPYADMESYYNANSTIWDDMSRMRGEFGSLVGSGFSSVYRSIGDLFDDDNYFSAPDIESGMEFEDAMAIGNSSRGGGLAFTNNLLLNSGYTFGIIGSIAVEELILAGATYLTGGGAAPVAGVRTAMNAGRLVKGAKNFFNISKMQTSTRALLNQLKNYDAAKSFWQAAKSGGKVVGNILTPQTYSALKNFKTAKNATQNANNLAKAKAGFGGFYRDFRSVNLALAESKLEGGMVYNELVREGVAIQKKKTGNVTPEQMAFIQNKAGEGAFYTTMTNAPLIFLSNQIVLGNAMGGFNRSLGKVFNDTFKKGLNGRLFKGKGVKDAATGKIKDVFEDAGSGIKGWWTKVKAGGVKGNTGMAIAATARYFAANVAEGLQEIGQEAIAVGTKGYYTTVMEDPLAGGVELQNDMILSGMSSQFSGQGIETFLSGFLMGGIVQGPQKLVFQGMPALYNRISDPKAYKEYQEQKKQYVADLVKVHNEAWNSTIDDPSGLFDPSKLNFLIQKQVAGAMKQNAFAQDRFGFTDEKDFGKFQQLYTIFQNGTSNYFRTQLTDFMQMSDEELGQAFPNQKSEIKSGKARQRLQDLVTNLDKFETSFENNKNRFTNPYDRSQYDKGSRQYILEAIKEKAFEHATYLYMFTEDGFKRATERADSIYTNLTNDPLFEKMAANDITVLLDIDSINNEMGLLLQDIAVQDKDSKEGKKIIDQKTDKIKKLQTIQQILTAPENLTKDGSFDRRKINKLTKAFEQYVQFMAESSNSFVDRSKVQDALKQMVDYHALKGRAKVYDKAIEYLNNPERLNEIVDRQIEVNKDIYKNLTKIHKQQIEKYINIKEANTLMNKLFEAGFVGDPEQVKKFLLSGNVNELKNFYDEQGDIDPKLDKVKYDQIQRLLDAYRKMSEKTDDSTETTEQESKDIEVQETKSNQEEILEDANIDVVLPESNNTPLLRALLDRQYRKYAGTQTVLEEKVKSFEEWRNGEGLNWQNTFNALKKLWVSGKLPILDAQGNPVFSELTDEDIKSEKGFETWLKSREVLENDLVKEILQAAGIPLNEMYYTEPVESDPTNVTPAVGNEDDEDKIDPAKPPRPSVFQVGVTSDVLKIITINQQGEAEALYKLVDKKGNNVSPELLGQIGITLNAFNDSGSAIAAMRELDKRAPDSTPFPFDGQMLFQGQLVYDKDGKEYRVISTPKFIQGGNLRLVPNNFEGKPITLQAGQFKNSYSIQEFKFNLLPANVSRVNINDINKLYPHADTVDGQRDYSYADDRLNLILNNLTQEEINNLVLVITSNKTINNETSKYIVSGKEKNPYVDIKQSKYSIGLAIPDGNTKTKINRILNENNIPLTDNENGVFAYIPNGNVTMQDPQGNPIKSLSNISREQALNTLFVSPELKNKLDQKQALELARNNFALNALLVSYADSVMKSNADTNIVSLNELPFGLGFVSQKGGMSYDNSTTRSLRELRYEHADENGNYFIFDLKRKKGGSRSVEFITSLEGSEGVKLSNKIKSRLQKDSLWDGVKNGTDRYIAIVQLPDGSYRPVNLKARTYNKSQRDDLASKLVDRAQKTKKENLDENGKAKDLAYNTQFNEEDIRGSVFISAKAGYNISLQVTPWGKLQLQLYNTDINKQIGDTITVDIPAADSKSFVSDSSINGYIQTLINDFNNNAEIAASKNKISNNNFRQSFPTQVSAVDLIDATTTNVRPEVVLNSSARATGDSSAIQAEKDKGDIKEDVVEAVEESNFTSEEAEFSLLDLSDPAFAEFAAKDFITLPSEYINHIVNKIVREGKDNLTPREDEVYNMRAATINVMVSKKGGEGSQPTQQDITTNAVFTETLRYTDAEGNPITVGEEKIATSIQERSEGVKQIVSIYTGGGLFFQINASGFEVAQSLSANGVTLEQAKAAIPGLNGKIKDWFQRGIDYLEPKQQQTSEVENKKADVEKRRQEELKSWLPSDVIKINEQANQVKDVPENPSKDASFFRKVIKPIIDSNRTIFNEIAGLLYYGIDSFKSNNETYKIVSNKTVYKEIVRESDNKVIATLSKGDFQGNEYEVLNILKNIQPTISSETANRINAKYDAELAALGIQQTSGLEDVKQKLDILKTQLLEGVAPKDRGRILRTNEEYQKLLAQRKAIEKEANKIMSSSDLSLSDIEDIDVFTDWAASNLPSFINIADITTLGNNLKAGGVRVGAFVLGLNHVAGGQNVSGTIYTGAKSPYKYHEAFHGVFRMLLSNEEIAKYRSIARKEVRAKLRAEGKSFEKELQKFKNSADTYSNMTRKQLENEYYEEYLADEFEKFKIDPKSTNTDASVKSLFTRIIEWIQGVFNSYSKNELRTLFENIDSGKFKGAQIANNEFTTALDVGTTIEANALIPHDSISKDGSLGYIYLDSDIADPLIRNISAMFLQRISGLTESYSPAVQMDSILDDFQWLYSLDNPINENKTDLQKEKLIEIQSAFDNYSDEIRNQSIQYINQISDKANEEEFQVEEFEDSTGLRTTSEYEKDASMIGGFRSLSSQLRAYIATTSVEATDYFGNTELTNGEPIIIAVDFVEAYNGLLKAVKNLSDPKQILQSMYFFGQDNSETAAVVRRILNDVGITEQELLSDNAIPLEINSPLLFQSILKGFENFRVDYLFNERDNAGNTIVYSASERDDINSQLDRWSQGFISKRKQLLSNPKLKTELITLLAEIQSEIIPNSKGISSTKLKKDAKKYSEQLFNLSGIKISSLYLQYSMLYNRADLKSDQRAFLELNKNERPSLTHDLDGKPYKESSIALMSQLIQDNNDIFAVDESGMDSRLKKMAVGNASFDETIGATVFKNPNGDLVYAHQLPTYHLKKVAELNNAESLEKLLESDPYLANNFLLNSAAFNQLSLESRLQIIRVAGNKIGSLLSTEEELDGSLQDVKQTSTYGDFTPQEFALNLINNYAGLLNSKSYKVSNVESLDDEGNKITTGLAPVLIRVMEASNRGDMISLPVIKTVEMINGQAVLTEETVDIYIDKIRTEFARINREANNATKTQEDILGYTDGRALTFFNTKTLMSEEQQTFLINAAIQAGNAGNVITLDDALAGTVTVYEGLGVSNSSINLNKITNTKVGESVTLFINNMPVKYKRVDENYFEGKQITKKQETDFINSVEATTTPIEEFIENKGTKVRYSLDEFINFYLDKLPKNQITPQPTQQTSSTINIYAGTNENAELSNFAKRPFELGDGTIYPTVEHAFQLEKLNYAGSLDMTESEIDSIFEKVLKMTPSQAKRWGSTIKDFNTSEWDKDSISLMKRFIRLSFEQNPGALKTLLATGNATLTHTQDRGKWGKLFPQLLMEVRSELGGSQPIQQTSEVAVKEVAEGIKIIDNALTSSEELEIFEMIKPFLESQGSRSNKSKAAPIMIGMGLRWDYKSNNPGKSPVEIKETIVNSEGQRNKYAYYDVSIDGEALGAIPTRLKELMTKATGIDASNYDGAIINIYPKNGFISAHNDVDESVTAINYPVIVANIGGPGSLSVEGAESQKARKGYSSKEYINEPLSSGSAYIFGENGKNRDVFHRTLPSSGEGNLPQLNVKGQIIPANSYRISVTLRRVKDLEPGMPTTPNKITQPIQQTSEVDTITYTPKGKQRQTYIIRGSQIFNQKDQEVFAEDSIDRNKIFANLAVKQGRAVVVNYKGTDYIVNNKQDIMSTVSGKIMKWGPENGNRKAVLSLAQNLQSEASAQQVSEVIGRESIISIGYNNQVLRKNQIKDVTSDINKEFPVYKFSKDDLKNPQYKFAIDLLKEKGYLLDTSGYMFTKGGVDARTIKKQPAQQTSEVTKEVSGMTALRDNVVDNLESRFQVFEQLIDELKIQDQISNQVKSGPIIAAGVSRTALVQSASLLNLNDNYRHNLKQIFFNDAINSYSINEILLGDQAVSLKDSVDQIKRAKMQNASYYSAYSAITAPEHGVVHPVEDISLVTLEEPEDAGIDIADAQMYITTKAFRYMWFGFGKLTAAQAELINRIETGQTITSDSIFGNEVTPEGYAKMQALLNSKKLVYGDGSTFLKMSAFTLTPEYTSIWNEDVEKWLPKPGMESLHNLRVKLEAIEKEKETIAIAAPLSAVKMKKQRVNSLEELGDETPFTKGYTTLDARFMGLQQLNPSNKLEQVDPTQIKQILTSEQNDDQFVPALNMTVGKIREEYNKAVSKRVTLRFNDKTNLIFSFDGAMDELGISQASGKVTPKLAAFLEFALNGLKASKSSSQILEFFSMTDGVPNYNLNNQITVRKFEQLFLSYFSKGVFSERTPGLGLTLVSDFGNKVYRRVFEIKDGIPIRSEIIRRDAWQGSENDLLNIDSLTQENIGPEGVVVLDRLRHGVMEYDSNGEPTGQRYTEMMMPAHHKSVMDLIQNTPSATMPEVISKMFAVRIPSQDNHSAMNVKWVDFMPVYYGSSAMFARELVKVSGADFDIDKVFTQFKDFYVKDGEFFEYGNKNTVEENYSDYIRYVNANVNKSGTIYSEAYLTYDKNLDAATIDDSVTDAEEKAYYQLLTKENIVTDAGLKEAGVKALQMLGLPITKSQYSDYVSKFGEPYAAPLNNQILDYKYALLGNDSVASGENPISYSPAALDILESTLATLAENSNVFKNRMLEENNDVDDLVGKILAFKANKGASIGAAVLPNLYLSLLTEYGINLKSPISIDGVTYDSFKYTTENKNEGDQRKQDTISSLITMATDNAKERLFSKLGLNRHALGLVSMMTSLSVPIRTSILLINNPVIQDLYSQALNKKDKFDPGIEKLVENKIKELVEDGSTLKVNDELLLNAINEPEGVSDQETVSILSKFKEFMDLETFTNKMSAPTSLTKGLGKDIATVLDKKEKIQELLSQDAPLDLSKIYNSNTWNSTYLRLFKQFTDKLLPATFLSSSPVFQDILNNVVDNIDTRAATLKTEDVQNIALDLLSYLNIKGYQYNLLQNGTLNEKVLSNDLIYPNSDRSIVDVINEIKEVLESKNESNFFIDNFVIPESASDAGNSSGLNIAMANTFRNLSAPQKVDLQNSFAQLYGSLDTKNQAQTIINYIMVKDGLQLRYGSLLEAIAPFTINKFLSHINTVEQAVRGDVSFESVFGLSQEELTKEFTEGFLESNINGSKLWTFERSLTTGSLQPGVQVKDNEVTVNWDAIGLSRDVTPNYVRIIDIQGAIKTYKKDVESKTYKEIETYGSNQQTHIGFMFGPRPTYKEVRNFVKSKNGTRQDVPLDFTAGIEGAISIQEELLKADNVNIEATENSIEVQLDPEAAMINVADTAFLLEQLGLNEIAQDQSELEANVIDNVDTSLPEVDEVESQLTLDFEMELEEQFTTITNFWDANIQGNKKAMASLRENNILSLEDLIAEYNNGIYESEESFIDQIKKCNL